MRRGTTEITPSGPSRRAAISDYRGERHVVITRYLAEDPAAVWARLTRALGIVAPAPVPAPPGAKRAEPPSVPERAEPPSVAERAEPPSVAERAEPPSVAERAERDEAPTPVARAEECTVDVWDPPIRFEGRTHDSPPRRLWFELVPDEDVTVLTAGQILAPGDDAGSIAAHWEQHLDDLLADPGR